MNAKEVRCEYCVFWDKELGLPIEAEKTGWCRRYAPRSRILEQDGTHIREAVWPTTFDSEWCGEGQMKEIPD